MPVWAQQGDRRDGPPIAPPVAPSNARISTAGAHLYAPNKWGILRVDLSNPRDEPVELLATTYFIDEPTLQFGRRTWVPPKARLQTWHPVLIPAHVSDDGRRAHTRTLVTRTGGDREVLIRSDSGHLQFDGTLPVAKSPPVTGIIDSLTASDEDQEVPPVDLLIAAQNAALYNRHNAYLTDRVFAPGEESLDALDQLVMVDGRVADDATGLAAIRRWLFGGGHLWVMLDRVDSRVLELILGDEFALEVIDRVGLTKIQIESRELDASRGSTQEYDRPVEFLRVAVTDVKVDYTVDGWPAAFWKPYGEGWLLVTTLGARGWMRPQTAADRAPALPARAAGAASGPPGNTLPAPPAEPAEVGDASHDREKYLLQSAMQGLAVRFFSPRAASSLPAAELERQVEDYVGYSIPPRWLIATLLIGLLLLVAILALFLWRQGRPEIMGWAGPLSAVAIGLVLVFVGRHHRQAVPATVASLQFVQPVPGTDEVRVQGVAGLYSPEGGPAKVAAEHGGWLLPEMTGLEGRARRMVWNDLDVWQWENFSELAGLRSAACLGASTRPGRLEASATFGLQAIQGDLRMGARLMAEDAILATRDGRIAVNVRSDGTFEARHVDVFAPEQFIAGAFWTDEQNRRARILELLLTGPPSQDDTAAPQLLFWTEPWDLGFEFDADRKSLGAALVAVPLHWQRPPPGSRAFVPSPLLPYRAVLGPDGLVPGLWDYRKRHWQEKSVPSATWLRFQVPPVLLPATVERARLVLQVAGHVGKLEIAGLRNKTAGPLKTWVDPWGKLSLEITQSDLLPISADGGLLLRISGGAPVRSDLTKSDPPSDSKIDSWRVESLSLDIEVKTAGVPTAVKPQQEEK
ncbi:MAG TPA: hypothetical protein VGH74_02195 [Planctomycetaceae bacterium]